MRKLLSLFLLTLLLVVQPVLAQVSVDVGTISNILVQFSGVIFIIAFVIILLLIAGVFPRPGIGIPWGTIALLIAVLIVMVVPFFIDLEWLTTVFRPTLEAYKQSPLPEPAVSVLKMLGLPGEWTYVPAIIYFFILPFAAVFALIYAFLASLNIWGGVGNNINRLLAFIITIMTIPTGILARMTMVMFVFLGMWVLAVFFVTFVVGVFYRGAGVIRKERFTYKGMGKIFKEAENFRKYATKKLAEVPETKETQQILDKLKEIRDGLINKIYSGEIKFEEAKSKFDEQYKAAFGG